MFFREYPENGQQHYNFVCREGMRQEALADFADVFLAEIGNQRSAAKLLNAIKQATVLARCVMRLHCEAVTSDVFLDHRADCVRAKCNIILRYLDMIAP
jgi:hypothetical protein